MARRPMDQAVSDAVAEASQAARAFQAKQQDTLHLPARDKVELTPTPAPAPEREEANPNAKKPGEPAVQTVKARGNPREEAMRQIREARGEKEPEEEPVKPAAKKEPVVEKQAEPDTTQPEIETPSHEVPPVKMVRAKVDGVEFDAPEADVEAAGGIHAFQREKASENRLRESREALAEARRVQAQMVEWQQRQQTPVVPKVTDSEFIQSKLDVIRFGTQEEGATALQEVMSRGRVDEGAIIQRITEQTRHDTAVANFDKEFADLVKNEILLDAIVARRTKKLQQIEQQRKQGQNTSPIDWNTFYRTIGNEVRSVAGRQSQPATTPAAQADTTSPASDRDARKASSVVNLPTASARAALPEAEKPETREQSLNRLRKSRGLPMI